MGRVFPFQPIFQKVRYVLVQDSQSPGFVAASRRTLKDAQSLSVDFSRTFFHLEGGIDYCAHGIEEILADSIASSPKILRSSRYLACLLALSMNSAPLTIHRLLELAHHRINRHPQDRRRFFCSGYQPLKGIHKQRRSLLKVSAFETRPSLPIMLNS